MCHGIAEINFSCHCTNLFYDLPWLNMPSEQLRRKDKSVKQMSNAAFLSILFGEQYCTIYINLGPRQAFHGMLRTILRRNLFWQEIAELLRDSLCPLCSHLPVSHKWIKYAAPTRGPQKIEHVKWYILYPFGPVLA